MKKLLAVIVLVGLATTSAQAKPHWKRIAFKVSALTLASLAQYKATTYCSRGDVERCIEGYGERRAFNWFSIGMGSGTLFLSEKCSSDEGPKPACYGIGYMVPATQTALGIHDFLNYKPEDKNEKATLRSFARARIF